MVDSVMEPLTPISLRQAEYFIGLDARKLLSKSTLYDLGGHSTRIFHQVFKLTPRFIRRPLKLTSHLNMCL